MNLKEFADVPVEVTRSGRFVSAHAYRIYCLLSLFNEEWIPLYAIKSQIEFRIGDTTLIKSFRELKKLGLIQCSSKRIRNCNLIKFKILPRSRWTFSKAHLAHLGLING